jgi:hypothetical protein
VFEPTRSDIPLPEVPAVLKPPATQFVARVLRAVGWQVYVCKPKENAVGQFEWKFTEPIADLFDAEGTKVGTHGRGPVWKDTAGATSAAIADMGKARVDSPKPGNIPWLLLEATHREGKGAFARVTYIQRAETDGGVAPRAVDASYKEMELRVPYKAVYVFFESKK